MTEDNTPNPPMTPVEPEPPISDMSEPNALESNAPDSMIPVPTMPPPPPVKPASKLRVAIPLIVIGGFLAVVLYATRDSQSADDLANGTCFDIPTAASVKTVTKHECTEPHDAEVFHNTEYPDQDTYPITLSFDNFVSDTCTPIFATYTGEDYETSAYNYGYFYPTSDSWASGDRTITCYVQAGDNSKLTKSVKGAAAS